MAEKERYNVAEYNGDIIIYISRLQTVGRIISSQNSLQGWVSGFNYWTKQTRNLMVRVDVNVKTVFERDDIITANLDFFFLNPKKADLKWDILLSDFSAQFNGKIKIYMYEGDKGLEVELRGENYSVH